MAAAMGAPPRAVQWRDDGAARRQRWSRSPPVGGASREAPLAVGRALDGVAGGAEAAPDRPAIARGLGSARRARGPRSRSPPRALAARRHATFVKCAPNTRPGRPGFPPLGSRRAPGPGPAAHHAALGARAGRRASGRPSSRGPWASRRRSARARRRWRRGPWRRSACGPRPRLPCSARRGSTARGTPRERPDRDRQPVPR